MLVIWVKINVCLLYLSFMCIDIYYCRMLFDDYVVLWLCLWGVVCWLFSLIVGYVCWLCLTVMFVAYVC